MLYPKNIELSLALDILNTDIGKESLQTLLPDCNVQMTDSIIIFTCNIKSHYKRTGGQLHIITENGKKIAAEIKASYQYPDDKTFTMLAKGLYWNKQLD